MSGAAAASSAAVTVTEDDVQQYLSQSVDEYKDACSKGFAEHKFEPVVAGLTIGSHVMTNLINKCVTSTQQGQLTNADEQ